MRLPRALKSSAASPVLAVSAIFTVRDTIFHSGGFDSTIEDLTERAGIWRRLEQSPPFRAFALDEPDVLVSAHVFEVLA
jgi:hypothetical protein